MYTTTARMYVSNVSYSFTIDSHRNTQQLFTFEADASKGLSVYQNGTQKGAEQTIATNDSFNPSSIGQSGSSRTIDGLVQEIIIFNADQSANRQDIEWNINNHYSIYEQWNRNSAMSVRRSSDDTTKQIGFDGSSNMSEAEVLSFVNDASPVLDDYAGAVSAYSLRKVRTAYTGSAIKVRRSSDDALQDIGFNSNGDLDTTALTTFVNADVDVFTSDFSSDDDNFNALNGTDVGQQSILGVDDAYKLTLSGGNAAHIAEKGVIYQYGNSYTVSFDYYIPSGQTVTGLIAPIQSGNTGSTGLLNVTGSWQSVSVNIVVRDEGVGNSNDRKMRFYAHNGTTITFAADDDVFYLKNIVVTQTTADGHVTTWYDQTGNSDATQTTDSEQPLVVSAGAVVTEGDRPAMSLVDGQYFDNAGVDGYSRFDFFSVSKITDTTGMFLTFSTGGGKYSWVYTQGSANTTFYSSFGTPTMYSNSVLQSLSNRGDVYNAYNGHKIITTLGADTSSWTDGKFFAYTSPFGVSGTVQEIISFDSDQSSSRLGIEGNIGRYYNITGYRNGFVTKWYDQSNNNNHLENASASQQPKIVEDGVMITENGHPAIEFNRTGEDEVLSAAASFIQPVTHFFVRRMPNLGGSTQIPLSYASGSSTPWGEVYLSNGQFRIHFGAYLGTFEGVEDLLLQYVIADGASSTIAYNGAEGETGNAGTQSISELHVGRNSNAGSHEAHVKAQELIVYQRDASAIRREIEEIINRHYRIYL